MNELTAVHEIAIFTMCLAWLITIFNNIRKYNIQLAVSNTFWSFVLLVAAIAVMAVASSKDLILGVFAGVIANELSHRMRPAKVVVSDEK